MIQPRLWQHVKVELQDGAIVIARITDISVTPAGTRVRVVFGELVRTVDAHQIISAVERPSN